jgi:DNA-binding PadR family transcriptional regulator
LPGGIDKAKKMYYDIITIYRDNIVEGGKMGLFSSRRMRKRETRFEKGDIKYVILDLLREKSSYGYEIIHALEERFGGLYTPSAGTVYPTLQMLEEMGYVTAAQVEGRRVFTITPAGIKFLEEQKSQVADVRERMSGWWDRRSSSMEMYEVLDMLHDLRKFLKHRRRNMDPAKIPQLRSVVERAYREIETLLKD